MSRSLTIDAATAERLIRDGHLPPEAAKKDKRKAGKEFVVPYVIDAIGPLTFVLPIETASETNARCWQARSNRAKAARRIVSKAFGMHLRALAPIAEAYHRGEVVRLTLTRLGGHRLDNMANLGPALKATEDAVAQTLGADDGAPNWQATAAQEPGGFVGVRIEIETASGV